MSDIKSLAKQIGNNLQSRRREVFPGDTQADMAARLAVGVATYKRMEGGDARVSFRHYLEAARILRCENQVGELFTQPDNQAGLVGRLLKEGASGS